MHALIAVAGGRGISGIGLVVGVAKPKLGTGVDKACGFGLLLGDLSFGLDPFGPGLLLGGLAVVLRSGLRGVSLGPGLLGGLQLRGLRLGVTGLALRGLRALG